MIVSWYAPGRNGLPLSTPVCRSRRRPSGRKPRFTRHDWMGHFDRHGQPDSDYLRNRIGQAHL
jgi:hypothetical protein